ncbi:hypothetical protein DRJ00_05020 [Candidatus Aerophobetes bacterium]|uniref:MoaD/ThiS family protein n=1 Tax=Aerophobetes bacterium TaxID=2030807 RepID=A0A497E3Y3_UNCAE|nr:MAG: hypothetical protein DRJ00_05020 [Candidatus Aerophobetes bacterium]
MKVKVQLRLLKVNDDVEIELKESSTIRHLLEKLVSIYGDDLKKLIYSTRQRFGVMAIVNGERSKLDQKLKHKDELLLILPVVGG